MKILYANDHPAIAYAAAQMKKYLDKVTKTFDYAVTERVETLPDEAGDGEILLGLCSELGRDASEVEDPEIDDLTDADIREGRGFIAGSNPRSVLFGVYDFFKSFGCMWVRPGPEGEYIVHTDPMKKTFVSRKMADVRFRGECLEGSPSYEHLRATVEWAPKVHMNLFMIEQIVPYNYMSRWYRHAGNTVLPNEDIGREGCEKLIAALEQDMIKTGLQFHGLGHGYQPEPYGIHYETSYQPYTMNPKMQRAIALVGGKREFFGGSPFWTQLCMSNPEVIEEQTDWLADYAESKPYINFLHVWLGDACNNHCECENCVKHHPSDLYVKMLNRLDEKLTAKGLSTRVVFIAYIDTMWPPIKEKLNHPERFLMCTAVGGRDYSKPYDASVCEDPIPEWVRNHYQIRGGFPMIRKMFGAWQQKVGALPNFIYEYVFYTEHYNDPGSMELLTNYYHSIRQMSNLGFNGIMSDQSQRCAFPTGLPCMLTGEIQYDLHTPLDVLTVNYFKAAYGPLWASVLDYLKSLSAMFVPNSLRKRLSYDLNTFMDADNSKLYFKNDPAAPARLRSIISFVDAYMPKILRGEGSEDPCHARSFRILHVHAEYCQMLAEVLACAAEDDKEATKAAYARMKDRMSLLESTVQYEFEMALFTQWIEALIL